MFRARSIRCASQPLSSEWRPRTSERSIRRGFPNSPSLDDTSQTLTSKERPLGGPVFGKQLSQDASEPPTAILSKFCPSYRSVGSNSFTHLQTQSPGSKCNCHNTYHEFSDIQSGISLIGNSGATTCRRLTSNSNRSLTFK